MTKFKSEIEAAKQKLAELEEADMNTRMDMLADTAIFNNLESHFYNATIRDRDYQFNEFGEISEAVTYNALYDIEDEDREAFEALVSNSYGFRIDWDYSRIITDLGPDEIIINDDGDVFESGKCIIQRRDYRVTDDDGGTDENASISERNRLIEVHMEKTGYFPRVFEVDNYGNIRLVNTKE